MQMVIEIPEELKGVGEAVSAMVRQVEATWRSTRGGRAVEYPEIEQQLAKGAAAIERASHQAVLQGLDVDQPRVLIEGQGYNRVGRYEADYYTMAGPVRVTHTLYREQGQRNAKTVNAVSLRCGAVADGWLPGTAQAMLPPTIGVATATTKLITTQATMAERTRGSVAISVSVMRGTKAASSAE